MTKVLGQPARRLVQSVSRWVLACVLGWLAGAAVAADSFATMPPLGPGPYAVGCSTVAQDFTRLQPGEDAQTYWEGVPQTGRARYVTDLLAQPAQTLQLDVVVPDD